MNNITVKKSKYDNILVTNRDIKHISTNSNSMGPEELKKWLNSLRVK